MKKKRKGFWEMTTVELARATREYDRPGTIDRTRRMTPHESAQERKARSAGGRPRVGRGAARIDITIERGLLSRADAAARRQKIGRSEMIARGLQLILGRKAG